jgi:hypothetical protein
LGDRSRQFAAVNSTTVLVTQEKTASYVDYSS